jgi:hypothetical protein
MNQQLGKQIFPSKGGPPADPVASDPEDAKLGN